MTAASVARQVAALLCSPECAWPPDMDGDMLLATCEAEEVAGLLYHHASSRSGFATWPAAVKDRLAREAHEAAARELLVQAELKRVLAALAERGVKSLLLKGTPLAYQVYATPSVRTRSDTDLLVLKAQRDTAMAVLRSLGYGEPPFSAGEQLFGQRPLVYRDRWDGEHWLDVHWEVSAARVFAELLPFNELEATAVNVPALGPYARAPGTLHALLLACLHPVMHHRNAVRLIWIYDVHLLAGRLNADQWTSFVSLANAKRVRAVCAAGLELAREYFGTEVPDRVAEALATPPERPEPTAAYLMPGRRWLDEVASDLQARTFGERLALLREIAVPSPSYMFGSYGLGAAAWRWLALPALYLHRGMRGVGKVLRRAK